MPTATAPTVATFRSAIKTELLAAVNIGTLIVPVHDFLQWKIDDVNADSDIFVDSAKKFHFYMFTRVRSREFEDQARRRFFNIHTFEIHGYYDIKQDSASEKTFQDEVEAIRTRFRFNKNVFGIPERLEQVERTITAIEMDQVMFHNVLCWHCRLTVEVEAIATESGDGTP